MFRTEAATTSGVRPTGCALEIAARVDLHARGRLELGNGNGPAMRTFIDAKPRRWAFTTTP